jgi:hypothetical protein
MTVDVGVVEQCLLGPGIVVILRIWQLGCIQMPVIAGHFGAMRVVVAV